MKKAAEKATPNLIRDFGELERLQNSRKSLDNFVELSRKKAQERIVKELTGARPDFLVVCDAADHLVNPNEPEQFTWLVKSISGVTNFARGIPYFATAIALMQGPDLIAGITFDHLKSDCFKAEHGSGAFISNRNRLRVSGNEAITGAIVALHTSPSISTMLIEMGAQPRTTGSLALDLAYLASGKYDCIIAHAASFLDIASGIVLIRESGGLLNYSRNNAGEAVCDIVAAAAPVLMRSVSEALSAAHA
jgi:myo-inositol-1(or 4)-monophosphatase